MGRVEFGGDLVFDDFVKSLYLTFEFVKNFVYIDLIVSIFNTLVLHN